MLTLFGSLPSATPANIAVPLDAPPTSSDANSDAIDQVRFTIASRAQTLEGGFTHFIQKIIGWFSQSQTPEEQEMDLSFLRPLTIDLGFITKLNAFLQKPTTKLQNQLISYTNLNQNDLSLFTMTQTLLSLVRNNYREDPKIKCIVDQLIGVFYPKMDQSSQLIMLFTAIKTENDDLYLYLKELNRMYRGLAQPTESGILLDLFLKQNLTEAKSNLADYPYFSHDIPQEKLICANGTVLDVDSFNIHMGNCYKHYLDSKSGSKVEEKEEPEQEWRDCLKAIRVG